MPTDREGRGCHPELKKGDTHDDPGTVICGPRPGLAAVERAGRWHGDGREVAATVKGRIWGPSWIWTTWAIWSRAPSPFGAPARANRRASTTGRHPPFSWSPLLGRGNNKRCCLLGCCCWDRATGSFHFPIASWSLFRPVSTRPAAGCSPLAVQSVAHGRTWSIVRLWMQTRDGRVGGGLTFLTLSAGWMRDVLSRRTPVPRHPSQEPCQGPRQGPRQEQCPGQEQSGTLHARRISLHPLTDLSPHTQEDCIHASTHPRKQAPTLLRPGAANQPTPTHSLPTPPLSTLATIRFETCVVLCPVGPGSVGLGRAGRCTLTCSTLARPPTFRG